jgi:endo-1,4-beta-xylanase
MKIKSPPGPTIASFTLLLAVCLNMRAAADHPSVAPDPGVGKTSPVVWDAVTDGVAKEATNLPAPIEIPLWGEASAMPGLLPGAGPGADDGTGRWRNVGIPGALVYLPPSRGSEKSEGKRPALIVCPGGGYTHLTRLVGADGAVQAFLPENIVVIALKYRLNPPSGAVEKDALEDGRRAVRLARAHAGEWGIDPCRIGMIGWSAGANLSLNAATHADGGNPSATDPVERFPSRPDFVALLSPWPGKPAHPASDYPVDKTTPPAFIASARDDKTAPVTFAEEIASSYALAGVRHVLWTPETGGHGAFTIGAPGEGGKWVGRFLEWIKGDPRK